MERTLATRGTVLAIAGKTRNGAGFDREGHLGVQVYHDQPVHWLTRGLVARTYCSDSGKHVASLTGL